MASPVMEELRSFVPRRALSPAEGIALAELQATRLLKAADVTAPPVPVEEIAAELLGIPVVRRAGLPVAALATTVGSGWLIALRAEDAPTRRRFSCAHELGHLLYDDCAGRTRSHPGHADERAERLCDLFAANLLMPRSWVKADWASRGIQDVSMLARRYEVSWSAMNYRLDQLGLQVSRLRCAGMPGMRAAA
jgi:Zn-dependent peptidase ImmA (M78 family)